MTLVPEAFGAAVSRYAPEGGDEAEPGASWLRRLPHLVAELMDQWGLERDGPSRHGVCALVLPVRRDGAAAALKVSWPHPEARHEHLALRAWDGHGAVRLLAADPARWAMLLERLDADRDLHAVPVDQACATLGDLLRDLDRPALPQLARLSHWADRQVGDFSAAPHGIPRRLVEQASALARELATDPGTDSRLVHTDLHYANVLAGARAPWLAIDPKPMAAEPAFAVAPALWNRWAEVVDSHDARRHLRRRVAVICDHAGLEEERARAWAMVRLCDHALDAAASGDDQGLTLAVTVMKAMAG